MLHQALKRYVFRAFLSRGAAVALGFQLRVVGSAEISVGVPTHTEVRPKHRRIKLSFFSEGGAGTFNQRVVLANFRSQNIIWFSDCRPVNVAVCFVSEAPNQVG